MLMPCNPYERGFAECEGYESAPQRNPYLPDDESQAMRDVPEPAIVMLVTLALAAVLRRKAHR
jgi:hypothetical protein